MKKLAVLLTLIFFVPCINSYAQKKDPVFQFGFKLAPNLGWMKPDREGYSAEGMTFGFNWGFIGEFKFAPNYTLCSGFTVAMNGGKLKYPYKIDYTNPVYSELGTNHRKYTFKAIEVPVVLKMKTNEIGYLRYYGQIGLGTSVNISAKAKDEFNVDSPTPKTETASPDIKSDTRFFRESMIIGIGVEYNISGTTTAIIGINFDNGISNVLKGINPISSQIEKSISNYLEFNLGILF
jgi:hypothetical protein